MELRGKNLLCRSRTGPANLVGNSGVIGLVWMLILLLCPVTGGGQSQDSHALVLDCSLQLRLETEGAKDPCWLHSLKVSSKPLPEVEFSDTPLCQPERKRKDRKERKEPIDFIFYR